MQIGVLILVVTLVVLFSGLPIAWGSGAGVGRLPAGVSGTGQPQNVPLLMMDELASFALLTIPLFVLLGPRSGPVRPRKDIYESLHRWLDRVPGGLVIANILAVRRLLRHLRLLPRDGRSDWKSRSARDAPPRRATGTCDRLDMRRRHTWHSDSAFDHDDPVRHRHRDVDWPAVPRGCCAGSAASAVVRDLRLDRHPARAEERCHSEVTRYSLREKVEGLGRVAPFIAIVVAIAYAMYGGLATPSEVAAISALLALVLVIIVYRTWRAGDLWVIFRATVRESTMILMIIGAAAVFSYMMSLLYVTQSSAQWLVDLNLNKWALMISINAFLLLAGCFLPPVAIILMVMPILTPVLEAQGFDLIWFAVILTINMEIGLITPPVGLNLYVLKGVRPTFR